MIVRLVVPSSRVKTDMSTGLSQYQGLLSQADIELSVISKNFFFTFFNLFLAFTVS